ncbi:MAG: DUF1846 family protein [bacterium]|nr:DUF1846 family protein [bacterium]
MEVGGKFLFDGHASRVLPGFDPKSKLRIFQDLVSQAELLYAVNAQDLEHNRQLSNEDIPYKKYVLQQLSSFEKELHLKAKVVITMIHQ